MLRIKINTLKNENVTVFGSGVLSAQIAFQTAYHEPVKDADLTIEAIPESVLNIK